jgi:hypothetical protein
MKPTPNTAPVFALDAATTWADLENDMAACVQYQSDKLGKIIPLMLFAPLTEPENLDAWEPMKKLPENLLVVSIERKVDVTILQAIRQAEAILGAVQQAVAAPAVSINFELPLADVYRQMTVAGIPIHTHTQAHKDDPSFFFLRGSAAVKAFSKELRAVTS